VTRPTLAVSAVIRRDGTLLLVRRARPPASGRWALPGGRVAAGERLADAVRREVREETGLDIEAGALVGIHERIGPGEHHVIVCLEAHPTDPGADPAAGDDAAEVSWFDRGRLAEVDLVPGMLDFLVAHGVVPVDDP
jgi:8-oxo-dGTP diphosphatase